MNLKIFLILIIAFFISFLLKSENDFEQVKLDVQINNESNINFKNIGADQIIKGTIIGHIESIKDKNFQNAKLECDFIGRSYKGRGFSCGFAIIEDLQGFCYMNKENKNDILIASWSCNTAVGINGNNCLGKIKLIQGFGKFAGVTGFGNINMPLADSLSDKISVPMNLSLKIKYPLSLN